MITPPLSRDKLTPNQELFDKAATPKVQQRTSRTSLATYGLIPDAQTPLNGAGADYGDEHASDSTNDHENMEIPTEDVEAIAVPATTSARRNHSRTQHRQITADPKDAWTYRAAPSQSRQIPLPFKPSCDYITPINYDEPNDGDSFSADFSLVIALDGRWHALHCLQCGANSPKSRNTGLFNGELSLRAHMRIAHDLNSVDLRRCIHRSFDRADVQRLLQGLHPVSGPIEEVKYR